MTSRFAAFCALAALTLLAGCNQQRITMCPGAAILADTASETIFRAGAPQDLSGIAYTATMTGVKSDCTFDTQQGQTSSDLDISFKAVRAPSPDAAHYSLAYFVTVNSAGRVLSKKMYTVRFDFAPGAAVALADESLGRTPISLERGLLPNDYQFLTGFQLSPEQLAYNRKMGRYIP